MEIYENDEDSVKEVLKKIYAQFELLPSQLSDCINNQDFGQLAYLCHKLSNSALLTGHKDLQACLLELHDNINEQQIDSKHIKIKSDKIVTLLPPILNSINQHLRYFI